MVSAAPQLPELELNQSLHAAGTLGLRDTALLTALFNRAGALLPAMSARGCCTTLQTMARLELPSSRPFAGSEGFAKAVALRLLVCLQEDEHVAL